METKKKPIKYERMGLAEVVNVLCNYDIKRTEFPINYMARALGKEDTLTLRGMAMDDQKLILIDKEQGLEYMRETVMHEIYHCHFYLTGQLHGRTMAQEEAVVRRIAREHTTDLYQKK